MTKVVNSAKLRITATYNGDSNFLPSTSSVLSQVVQGAIASISASSLNFGNQTVGMSSGSQVVTLTNTGNIALTLSASVTGANSADFSQTNTCGSLVAAGTTCTVSVTFNPTTTGTRTAFLTFTDNAPNSPQSVSLAGVGVTPTVQLSPPSLTFPTQVVLTASKPQVVTLTNIGLGILKISGGGVSGPFGLSTTCGGTVNPGASCTINVTFRPKTKGSLTGSISVKDNAPDSPQKIPLSGTGTYIQTTPTSINFGNQPVSTKSLQKKITVSNKGSVAVSVTGISITGANPNDFAQVNNCGTSIAAGASCFIGVTFTPSAKGARSASVSISDNGGGSPQQVALSGTGT